MKHLIEITLITLILILIAFLVGCKEEVDYDDFEIIISPQHRPFYKCPIHGEQEGCLTIFSGETSRTFCIQCYTDFITKHVSQVEILDPNEPNEPEIISFPDEGLDISEASELEVVFEPETNEPQLVIDIPWHRWECSCGEKWYELLSLKCSCGKIYNTFDLLMNNFPTWPEYIELEKELVIIWPKEILEGGWDYQPKIIMSKGTKIYFKEDD